MNAKATTPVKRTFDFTASTSIPVPTDIPSRSTELPFKQLFTDNLGAALEGKQPHIFIPDAYWTEERGIEAAKVTPAYGKDKVRGQFTEWKKKDAAREVLALITIYRDGKSADFKEPGVSFWIVKK